LEHGSRPIARTATGRGTDALPYETKKKRTTEGLRWSGIGPPGGLQEEEIGLIRFVFLEFANYLAGRIKGRKEDHRGILKDLKSGCKQRFKVMHII
jgi:hypothetical protein